MDKTKVPLAKKPSKENETALLAKHVAAVNALHHQVFEYLTGQEWNPTKAVIFGQPSIRVVIEDDRHNFTTLELIQFQSGDPGIWLHAGRDPGGVGKNGAPYSYQFTYDEDTDTLHGPEAADAFDSVCEAISRYLAQGHAPEV
jgi:hypothetical protein